MATDEGAGLVRGVEVTTGNEHDGAKLRRVLPDNPGEAYGDSAFGGSRSAGTIQAKDGVPAIVGIGTWGGLAALARLTAHNARVHRVRCRIEKVVGTWKRRYGLRRMRWLGLAKAELQVRLAAMAYDLCRTLTLLRPVTA